MPDTPARPSLVWCAVAGMDSISPKTISSLSMPAVPVNCLRRIGMLRNKFAEISPDAMA